jgi:hypothetical protein
MNRVKTNRKYILILIAFAIGWFSLYSIINFHQHRIFGKELKYNVYPSLCKKEENLVPILLEQKNSNEKDRGLHLDIIAYFPETPDITPETHSSYIYFLTIHTCCHSDYYNQNGLRAPPSVS